MRTRRLFQFQGVHKNEQMGFYSKELPHFDGIEIKSSSFMNFRIRSVFNDNLCNFPSSKHVEQSKSVTALLLTRFKPDRSQQKVLQISSL